MAQLLARAPGERKCSQERHSCYFGRVPKSGQLWDPAFLKRSVLLRELQQLGRPLLAGAAWPTLEAYGALAESERKARASELHAVRFAPPEPRLRRSRARAPLHPRQLYDGRIALEREVPCVSASYHDLLNVLAWAAFPRAKRALHARQFRALTAWLPPGAVQLPNRRTREQDALALFDEGGSVLVLTPELAARTRGFPEGTLRLSESAARIVLFGHALMEHVSFESSRVRSAALVLCAEPPLPEGRALLELVDRAIAGRLADARELATPDGFDRALCIDPPDTAWL
jgi:hypothetical protein